MTAQSGDLPGEPGRWPAPSPRGSVWTLAEASVGGTSNGNFVAAQAIPVLDGLGAVGGGAHARSEHVSAAGMVERSALAAGLIAAFAMPG